MEDIQAFPVRDAVCFSLSLIELLIYLFQILRGGGMVLVLWYYISTLWGILPTNATRVCFI